MYRTYTKDRLFDSGIRCVRANSTFMYKKAKSVVHEVDYWDSYRHMRLQTRGYLHFTRTNGYNVSNVLDSRLAENTITGGTPFLIAFTDYKTCAVVRYPQAKGGCQVWMYADSMASADTSPCNFVCNILCGKEKHKVYDKDLCPEALTKPFPTKDEL
uniref:Golgi-destined protein n=1 Tax=Ornithodoros parkeri TaxID=140564 RepID=A6N9P2_ORNPR|nr:golgi-destined protein [Ornithodoros parkeri]